MIYIIIASTSFAIELVVWWLTSLGSVRSWTTHHSVGGSLWRASSMRISRLNSNRWPKSVSILRKLRRFNEASVRNKIEILVLRPFDVVSSSWLAYIMYVTRYTFEACTGLTLNSLAQTFGAYQTCRCKSSVWGRHEQHVKFSPTTAAHALIHS